MREELSWALWTGGIHDFFVIQWTAEETFHQTSHVFVERHWERFSRSNDLQHLRTFLKYDKNWEGKLHRVGATYKCTLCCFLDRQAFEPCPKSLSIVVVIVGEGVVTVLLSLSLVATLSYSSCKITRNNAKFLTFSNFLPSSKVPSALFKDSPPMKPFTINWWRVCKELSTWERMTQATKCLWVWF